MPDNEIGWGQGAVNNDIGWGKGASNNDIGWGIIQADSPSGDTDLGATASSSFSDTNSFKFDGVNERFESSTNFTCLDGQEYVGISFWVKIPDVSAEGSYILEIDNSELTYSLLFFIRTSGQCDVSMSTGGSFIRSNTGAITDNTWHHIFLRFDGSISDRYARMRIFVDGSINHSVSNFSSITSFPSESTTLKLANSIGPQHYYHANCFINELAFYTSGDDTLPNEIYNSGTANNLDDNTFTPFAWYRSENATYSGVWTMTDAKSNCSDLVSANMEEADRVEDVPSPAPAFSNTKSIAFDGVDDYIDCGNVTTLDGQTNISISGWFNQTTIDQKRVMFGTYSSSSNLIACYTWNDGKMYIDLRNGSTTYGQFDYSTVITAGEWFHLAMVFDGSGVDNASKLKLYINGSLQTLSYNGTLPTSTNATQGDFTIGTSQGFVYEWNGYIDEVAIWNKTLTPTEITEIYNSGTPIDLSSYNPNNWWRMGDGDTYPTITDNGSGGNDGTMTNMASGDIITNVP